uniref:Uncharacterized protein n=1 Tax=Arundo donax TaxID=35708 RepID=A0A0A9BW72_ARUDO
MMYYVVTWLLVKINLSVPVSQMLKEQRVVSLGWSYLQSASIPNLESDCC